MFLSGLLKNMIENAIYFFLRRIKRKRKRIKRKDVTYGGSKEKDTQITWKIIVIVSKHELPNQKRSKKLFELQIGRNLSDKLVKRFLKYIHRESNR